MLNYATIAKSHPPGAEVASVPNNLMAQVFLGLAPFLFVVHSAALILQPPWGGSCFRARLAKHLDI